MSPIEIFIAYAHNDLRYKDELKKFLRPLLHTGRARVWDDRDIESGQDWEAEIKTRLYGADVILLLVSPDSLASDYFYGREVAVSLERHKEGEAAVVPIILRPCHWTITPLAHIEAMPEKAKAVTSWASQDEAFTDIAHRLSELVEKLLVERQARDRMENARRDFDAAVQSADQLFAQNRWAEAREAYAAALKLHQNGFSPDRTTLERRRADCDAQQKQAAREQRRAGEVEREREKIESFENRRAAYKKALDRAGDLFARQQWTDALNAYREAERLREPNFPINFNAPSAAERIAYCRQMLGQSAGAALPASSPEVQRRLLTIMSTALGTLIITLIVVLINTCWPKKSTETTKNPGSELPGAPAAPVSTASMVFVKGGTFDMGDTFDEGSSDEKPVHRVTVADFYLGKNEVTFDEYDAFCTATKRTKPGDAGWGRGAQPVMNVSWNDAVAYCNWRSQNENLAPCYAINGDQVTCDWAANGYRLPTEAEWEYAARQGGQKVRFGNGKNIADPAEINFNASAAYKKDYSVAGVYRQKTTPVGGFPPNSLGLCDMSGNVWEWCWDWYGNYPSGAVTNPHGVDSGAVHVLRGGSWNFNPENCRSAFRLNFPANARSSSLGFRLARGY